MRNFNGYQGQANVDAAIQVATIQGRPLGTPRQLAAPTIAPLERESGARSTIVCIMPYTNAASGAIYDLEEELVNLFGGFTRSETVGGWFDGFKARLEQSYRYEVSFVPSLASAEAAHKLFRVCGAALDQTWVHIELHKRAFEAQHVKVGTGAAYDNS